MDYSKFKWSCPYCDAKDNHKIVGTKDTDSSTAVYECNSCQELFTTTSGCGLYLSEIQYNGQLDKSTIK